MPMLGCAMISYISIDYAVADGKATDKITKYSFFQSVVNKNDEISVIKINKTLLRDNIVDNYEIIIDKGIELDTATLNSLLLSDNFEYQYKLDSLYANDKSLTVSPNPFTGSISSKALNTVYQSKNNKKLTYTLPLNYIDISHQPIFSLQANRGVYVSEMTTMLAITDSDESSVDRQSLISSPFPVGSECLKYEQTKFDFPHYDVNLTTYDTNLKLW